ncbi:helix-turn-helix transcriptional regulator [Agrobacterium sp.]|uniref:ArsR/SmtB family transcription factor n=1 Tax=Agrobacterium sp. TaxID=361 RepID=UPI0028A631E2|nr:helix-turn-helix transcriptional regulator [Agrobacterium sp.]
MPDLLPQPDRDEIDLGVVLSTLSDPLRRTTVAILATLPECTERNCVSFGFPVAKASLTHHFKVLREAGLISQIDYGNRRTSSLRKADIEARFPGLLALLVNELEQAGGSDKAVALSAQR